jgi:hypothetical protein
MLLTAFSLNPKISEAIIPLVETILIPGVEIPDVMFILLPTTVKIGMFCVVYNAVLKIKVLIASTKTLIVWKFVSTKVTSHVISLQTMVKKLELFEDLTLQNPIGISHPFKEIDCRFLNTF